MGNVRILVVGSINMDVVTRVDRLPRPGETVPGLGMDFTAGGKGANQAVAAARLGADVVMVGCVGDDSFGDELLKNLKSEGINISLVRRLEQIPSGAAVICVDANGQNSIVVAAGANGSLTANDIESTDAWDDARVVLLQLETPLETVEAVVESARRRGVLSILDPAPAPTAGLPDRLFDVDVLTPNQSEAESLAGVAVESIADADKAARILQLRGARNVVLKLGELGAYWLGSAERGLHVKAPSVEVVNTTAAGDAFNGALGVALADGRSFEDAVGFACTAGSLACTQHGAQHAMPTRTQVEALMSRLGASP